jgi:RNA polymerase sigma-70 factor (ECF subfamily)
LGAPGQTWVASFEVPPQSRGGRADKTTIANSFPTLQELSEALAVARQGDEDGIRVLYRWLNPPLLRYLRYQAASVAEDLASEVWLAVARGIADFDSGPEALRAFVFAVAHRRVIDHRRSRSRQRPTMSIESVDEPSARDDTEELVLGRLVAERAIEVLVRDLPADQAEIVLLRVLGDLSVEQVAAILGKSAGAIRVAQHRGLRRLSRKQDESGVTI